MREFVYNAWTAIMDDRRNPLSNIPDLGVRHVIMQVLAWMWCIVFSMYLGSITAFGVSAIAHVFLIAAVVVTVGTFETAKRNPNSFRFIKGYHSYGRGRTYTIYHDEKTGLPKKVYLDPKDPGGEHE